MAEIKKIGEEYFVEFHAQGLMFRKNGGRDRRRAEKLLAEIKASVPENIEDIYKVRDPSCEEFFNGFLSYGRQIHNEISLKRIGDVVNTFKGYLKDKLSHEQKLREITPKVIENYQAHLMDQDHPLIKSKMINFCFFVLRDMFDYAIKKGNLNDNPTLHLKMLPRESVRLPMILKENELKVLLEHSKEPLTSLIIFIVATGLRTEELVSLKWKDVFWDKNCLMVVNCWGRLKKAELRTIPLCGEALEILKNQNRLKKDA